MKYRVFPVNDKYKGLATVAEFLNCSVLFFPLLKCNSRASAPVPKKSSWLYLFMSSLMMYAICFLPAAVDTVAMN
jgi:hypothetical protein